MTKFYEFGDNNITFIARDGSPIVVKDRTFADDGSNSAVTEFLANLLARNKVVEVAEAQYNSVRASFALNDPHHALREQMRQELLAEMSTKGIAVSSVVNNPSAGVSNESKQLVETKSEADATDLLKAVAKKN